MAVKSSKTTNAAHIVGQQHANSTTDPPGLGPRKTLFVLVTVVGCIAILWPKIFYPMMFGAAPDTVPQIKNNYINKDVRAGGSGLRQERPPHLRSGLIHPAMIERGRAIPNTQSVPIVADKPQRATEAAPQIIDGRPGPIPGMRPPMGAGSVHQANQKGSSMGLIMPLYTIGIVAFFVYTIMKVVMKKPDNATPYPVPIKPDPNFKEEVFRRGGADKKVSNFGWKEHDTIVTAIQGLIDAADEQLNKRENAVDLSKDSTDGEIKENKLPLNSGITTNGHIETVAVQINHKPVQLDNFVDATTINATKTPINDFVKVEPSVKKRDTSADRSLKIESEPEPEPEPQAIYLEGALPHESQILVADAETVSEGVYNEEVNGNADEPAVILSSKMTLSLINLDPVNTNGANADHNHSEKDDDEEDGESDKDIDPADVDDENEIEDEVEYEDEEIDEEEEEEEEDEEDESNENVQDLHDVGK